MDRTLGNNKGVRSPRARTIRRLVVVCLQVGQHPSASTPQEVLPLVPFRPLTWVPTNRRILLAPRPWPFRTTERATFRRWRQRFTVAPSRLTRLLAKIVLMRLIAKALLPSVHDMMSAPLNRTLARTNDPIRILRRVLPIARRVRQTSGTATKRFSAIKMRCRPWKRVLVTPLRGGIPRIPKIRNEDKVTKKVPTKNRHKVFRKNARPLEVSLQLVA